MPCNKQLYVIFIVLAPFLAVGDSARTSDRELIVVLNELKDVGPFLTESVEAECDCRISPLVPMRSDSFLHATNAVGKEALLKLSKCLYIEASDDRLDDLRDYFSSRSDVNAAYIKPAAEVPIAPNHSFVKAEISSEDTPLFQDRQGYLNPPPEGVNVPAVFNIPGGRGTNITVVDIELGADFLHEDLIQHGGRMVVGPNELGDHGTAVAGEINSFYNDFGTTGIASDTLVLGGNARGSPLASVMLASAEFLSTGDIILIELHTPGPRHNFTNVGGQLGYIAMEYFYDTYLAIQLLTNRGIIVIGAAGNGNENFDDPIYERRPNHFPTDWVNPFNRNNIDIGSILVGAGAPPPGTHGTDNGPDRSRLSFSNYGVAVDAQGWGVQVTTLGYGDLFDGGILQREYTDRFSGTSSATPIVVGAVCAIQGILKQQNRPLLNGFSARDLLRRQGSPQQDHPSRPRNQNIGTRPDLAAMLSLALVR